MTAQDAFQKITNGGADDFAQAIAICEQVRDYCLVGGLAVNCYVDPVYTLDADLVVHTDQLSKVRSLFEGEGFRLEGHPHSLNIQSPGSDLRIQLTKDPRYQDFVIRAQAKKVFGIHVKVACLEDIVQGKIWAWSDPQRRLSKRQKDQADLIRIAESYPEIRHRLPAELQKLFPSGHA